MLISRKKAGKVKVVNGMRIGLEVLDIGAETAREEGRNEGLSGLGNDVVVEVFPACFSLFVVHGKGLTDRFGGVAGVPRVDRDARAEAAVAVRASELYHPTPTSAHHLYIMRPGGNKRETHLAQNQRPIPPLLTLHKLMRPQRHSLPHARHQKRIRNRQQRKILREAHVARMQENDGLVGECAEPRVDTRDDVTNTAEQLILLGGLESDLEKDNFTAEVGVLVEESFKGKKFVAHTL